MRPVLYLASALMVMALAFWAYRENYASQKALRDLAALQDNISGLREDIAMQKAEWAYLNRPERLKELATVNFDRLHLLPLEPEQMADGKSVAFPLPPSEPAALVITGSADTSGTVAPAAASPAAPATAPVKPRKGDIAANPDDKAFP
jgi:hypothetical protein